MATATSQAPLHGHGAAADQGARIRAQMEQKRKSQMIHDGKIGKMNVDDSGWGRNKQDEKREKEKNAKEKEKQPKSKAKEERRAKEKKTSDEKAIKREKNTKEESASAKKATSSKRSSKKVDEEEHVAAEGDSVKEKVVDPTKQDDGKPSENENKKSQDIVAQKDRSEKSNDLQAVKDASKSDASVKAQTPDSPSKTKDGSFTEKKATSGAAVAAASTGAAGAAAAKKNKRRSSSHFLEPKVLSKGHCYPMEGIDNLTLLLEGDHYQTTCYSMYLFKTELDEKTLIKFFNKLVSWYPKFRYIAELSPQEASKKEKARKSGKPLQQGTDISLDAKEGRRTKYSKTLKAGGWLRPARWRYDEDFDVRSNIIEMNDGCPEGKDEAALFGLAGEFLSQHFDFTKPLWKALCVRGLDTKEGAKSALMIKVHHALSDGQGMIMSYHTALAALEQDAPIEEVQKTVDVRSKKGEQKKPGQRNVKPTLWGTTKHGFHTMRGLYLSSRKAFEYGPVAAGDSDFEGRTGNGRAKRRFYCHSEGIPMADIKTVRDAFSDSGLQLSLNDVACAVLSRALRVAAERTEPGRVKDKRVAIFVPISVRPIGNWEMTNFTTGAIAWFAFNDPQKVPYKDQLAQVNREMNRIKRSYWPKIWFNLFGWVSKHRALYLPNYPGWKQFFEKAYREYHVATNLPGPSKPVKFGEHEAYSYHVLPPSSPGKSTLSIGMISYADHFSLAVSCDGTREFENRRLASTICEAFQHAAQELVEAALAEREKNGKAQ